MPISAPPAVAAGRTAAGPEPLRRRSVPPRRTPALLRRAVHFFLIFTTIVLLVDALVGERGFLETLEARREHRELAASVDRLREENDRLREEVRRLNEDPAEIESVAREELGMVKPGELVFIIRDVKPSSAR